jgi:hypothetical protein
MTLSLPVIYRPIDPCTVIANQQIQDIGNSVPAMGRYQGRDWNNLKTLKVMKATIWC